MNWFENLFYLKSRIWILLFKFYPIVYNLWLLLGMVMCLLNKEYKDIGFLFIGGCFAWSVLSWKLSVDLHFCKWHRILILNQMLYLFFQLLSELYTEIIHYIYMALIFNIAALIFATASLIFATFLYYKYGCFSGVENNKSIRYRIKRCETRMHKVHEGRGTGGVFE